MNNTEQLYPITYRGEKLTKRDCHPVFVNTYTSRRALRFNTSVYLSGGMSVTPKGEYVTR